MIAAGANYLKYLITGDASQLKKELADAQQGINNLGGGGAGNSMRTVSGQMDAMAMSAKQLNAATRGLPAQFTDIFVSLQGGQAPLTVLLQQGGQLKDLFGGIMPAAKAMGGYILGLVNPYSLAAAAVIALGAAYYQGSQEADVWHKAMVTSGNAVGVTSSELRGYAQQLDGVAGTQHAAAMALGEMVQAGVAGGAQLRDYTQAAMAWESATGQAVGETAKQFKSLAKEPLEGVLKLNEGTNFLTLELYEQIKALDEQGRTTEAARLAQDAYAETLNTRSNQIKANLGSLEKAWAGVKGWAKQAWDAMLNVGRELTVDEKLAEARAKLDKLMTQPVGVYERGTHAARLARMQEVVAGLEAESAAQALNAAASEHNAKAVAAQADWDKVVISNLDKKAKMERELAEVRQKAAAAGVAGAELEGQLAAVREKYVEKAKKASTATQTAYETLIVSINEKRAAVDKELSQGEKLTEFEKLRLRYQQDLITRGREYSVQQRADIEAKLAAGEAAEKQAIAERALAKALEDDQKALERLQQQREKQLETLQSNLQKLRLEEEAHAYAAASGITHAEAVERLTIARLEEHLAMARQGTESQATIDWLERELAARRQIAEVMGQRGVREANEKAQKELEKDWERTSKTIGQTLSDYIMGGGKDAATYLKRLFATLVLQPVVNYGVQGAMGAIGMGPQQQGAPGSQSGIGNMGWALNMSNLASMGGWGLSAANTAGTAYANATNSGIDGLLASNGAYGTATNSTLSSVGTGLSYAGALYSATQGQWGSAVGTAVGTYFFGPIGAAIGGAIGGMVDGLFAGDSGTSHNGAGAIYKGGAVTDGADIYNRATFGMGARSEWSAGAQNNVSGVASGLGSALDGFAKAFGKEAGYTVATAFADDSSGDGAWGSLRITDALGNVLTDWEQSRSSKWAPKTFADGEEGYKQYLAAAAVDVKSAMLAMDLPGWANQLLNAATDLDTLNAALGQIAANKAGFDALAASMSMFKGISEELQTQLLATAGSMDALASVAGSYYGSSMYTEGERMLSARQQQMDALASMGLYIDPAEGDKAKALFKQTVEEAMRSGQGELAVKLMAMSASFAQVADYATKLFDDVESAARDAAEDARELALANAENAADGAWRNFEAAIDREKAYWQGIASASQEAIGQITGSVQLLQSTARDLYGTVDSTQQMLAAQGMVYVENALAAVRAGASITGFDGLQEAITAARGGISGGVYASEFERQRDTLVLAGQLSQLGDLGDAQLSVEERALKAAQEQIEQLDATLQYWQQQLDGTAQLIDTGLSIESAISALSAAITARDAIQNASGGGGGGGSAGGASTDSVLQKVGAAWAGGDWITAQNYIRGQGISNQQLQDAFDLSYEDLRYLYNRGITAQNPGQYSFKADTAEGVYAEAKAQGLTLSEVDKILGANPGDAQAWAQANGLPAFAGGGFHAGGLRLVGERGWEVEATGPARIWNQEQLGQALTGGSNAELIAEVRALREQVAALQAPMESTAEATRQHADQFDNATAGGNAMAVEVME